MSVYLLTGSNAVGRLSPRFHDGVRLREKLLFSRPDQIRLRNLKGL
ncbi:MAG: hypothetical protein JWR69_4530 [Pedosphaera sp.]|nr:hypothetical protein [Pedosphaera sp.]